MRNRRTIWLGLLFGGLFSAKFGQTAPALRVPQSRVPPTERARSQKTPQAPQSASNQGQTIDVTTLHWNAGRAFLHDTRGEAHSLTLEQTAQNHAVSLLRSANPRQGAIVVLRVSDGSVLVAADNPTHTPKQKSVLWSALTPSASLFKLVTTAALIEKAELGPSHRVCSEGGEHRLTEQQLLPPKQGKIRCQPFSTILATSRNAAYARLVTQHLDSEDLSNFADRFGFNEYSSVASPFELGRYEPAYSPLGIARTATGFIGSTLSAFGAAQLAFVIASGGRRVPIQLFRDETTDAAHANQDGATRTEQVLQPNTAHRLRDMMESVVRHGTAHEAFFYDDGRPVLQNISVAGKTGTLGHEEGTSSWFAGFAPSRNPEIVVAVLLENGPVWRTTAKSIAVEVFRNHFEAAAK